MTGKKYHWLLIVVGITLLLSGCDPGKTSCNSPCKILGGMTVYCDEPWICDQESMRCRNPDCPQVEDCNCPQEVEQDDPVTGHLQLIVLGGSVFIDQNANGEQDEGEQAAGDIEVKVVDQNCDEGCDPAATTKTDPEGSFSIEFYPGEGVIYTIEVDWEGWPAIYDYFGGDVYFGNFSENTSPDSKITKNIPLVPREIEIIDDREDTVCSETGEPVDNPAGDIESVVVGFNPDGTLRIELKPAEFVGTEANSTGAFVYLGEDLWMWHLNPEGRVDAGLFGGPSGEGYPNILPSDVQIETSADRWIYTWPTIPPDEVDPLPPDYLEFEINLFNQLMEGDPMTSDGLEINRAQMGNYDLWLNYQLSKYQLNQE